MSLELVGLILIVFSYVIALFSIFNYLAKVNNNPKNKMFIWHGVLFILAIPVYEYFKDSIYSFVVIAMYFLIALSYALYVVIKVKQSATA